MHDIQYNSLIFYTCTVTTLMLASQKKSEHRYLILLMTERIMHGFKIKTKLKLHFHFF